jgi:hypothetical protein
VFQAQLVKQSVVLLRYDTASLHYLFPTCQDNVTSQKDRILHQTIVKTHKLSSNELLSSYIYCVADVTFNNLHGISLFLWGRTYFSTHFVNINGVRHNIEILLHLSLLADFQITQKEHIISPLSSHVSFNTWTMTHGKLPYCQKWQTIVDR